MRKDRATISRAGGQRQWRRFGFWLLASAVGMPALLYAFILIVDPYDSLPFSPGWQRLQVAGADRHFKPAVARRAIYDSVIVGTSTAMMLHPGRLDELTGARFANLSMPAASPREQLRLLELFHRHHPEMRHTVVFLDLVWLYEDGAPAQLGANVGQLVPDWLYDENRWNDWPRFSGETLRHARRQARDLMRGEDPAGHAGYFDFTTREFSNWTLEQAQLQIYGPQSTRAGLPEKRPPGAQAAVNPDWQFPDMLALIRLLEAMPTGARKLLVFAPLHWFHQPVADEPGGAKLAEIKRRAVEAAGAIPNTVVIDFMFHSPVTLDDSNYWDGVHFREPIARQVEGVLARAARGEFRDSPSYSILYPVTGGDGRK